jgi:hypothetical protein
MYIYFKHLQKMYQFGPYNDNHSTAGTFAFRRKLLNMTKYDDTAALAEEKHFLKNYTVPFVQLDPLKTILVFSHDHNTFDKRRLLNADVNQAYTKETTKTVEQFIPDADMRNFYMVRIEELLENYVPGRPCMKPDVIKQMVKIEKERKKEMAKQQLLQQQQQTMPNITIQHADGTSQQISLEQVMQILQQQQAQIAHLTHQLQGKEAEINLLTTENNLLTTENNLLTKELKNNSII